MRRDTAILIVIIIFSFLIALFFISLLLIPFFQEEKIPTKGFLAVNLSGVIEEEKPEIPFFRTVPLTLKEFYVAVENAGKDKRIEGLYLKIYPLGVGPAKAKEIFDIVKRFRERGKKVIFYSETMGNLEYMIACSGDKIYLNPSGFLMLNGLASQTIFLKKTLDKLGIKAELEHIEEYKTASNTFTEDGFTPAHREMMNSLMDSIFDNFVKTISEGRGKSEEEIKTVIDKGPFTAEEALKEGLVDKLLHEDEVLREVKEENIIKFKTYLKKAKFFGKKKIAVLYAIGSINLGESGFDPVFGGYVMGSDTLHRVMREIEKDDSIKGVVMRIDSPGGSSTASDIILRGAKNIKTKKPLVISMSDVAGSGGYWIATESDWIVAQPSTLTASIGVIGGKFNLRGFYDKIGITMGIVKRGKFSDFYSDYRGFTEEEKEKVRKEIGWIYEEFKRRVSNCRKIDVLEIDKIGKGRVWTGEQAKELKLVDQLGGLNEAILKLKELAKIPEKEEVEIVFYPKRKRILERIFSMEGLGEGIPAELKYTLSLLVSADNANPQHYLLMPFLIKIN
ncbi:MAG: signal peptide peptidase SppA [Candidatus Aminicenantia bacterium]